MDEDRRHDELSDERKKEKQANESRRRSEKATQRESKRESNEHEHEVKSKKAKEEESGGQHFLHGGHGSPKVIDQRRFIDDFTNAPRRAVSSSRHQLHHNTLRRENRHPGPTNSRGNCFLNSFIRRRTVFMKRHQLRNPTTRRIDPLVISTDWKPSSRRIGL